MEIGYIIKNNTILSGIGELYIEKIKNYLGIEEKAEKGKGKKKK